MKAMAESRTGRLREIAWRLEAVGFDVFSTLMRALPADTASALGGAVFKALGPISGANRTARRNLELAYPESSEADRAAILSAQWDNFGRYIAEFPLLGRLTRDRDRVELVGAERLADIAASGRPTVFISGHFSNLEVMPAVIVAAGIDCEMTYRATNNPYVDERIRRSRFAYGVRLFAPKGRPGARTLLDAMAKGRSVAMLNDQRYDGGVPGLFFGKRVYTNPAAVRLALKFGCDIQPMSIERRRGARFMCIVHPPIRLTNTGNRAGDLEAGVAAINAFIEACVRRQPGEWWWLHRRWPAEAFATSDKTGHAA
jgi:KDO2-lipid IV(A) lauroyltransferase